MYETDQKMLYRVYVAFAFVLIALGAYVCFCISAGGTGANGLQNSTDREIGAVKEQQRQLGVEIGRVGAEVSAAEDALDRASGAVSDSQERARAVQAGVAECQKLARECQGLAKRNAELIDGLGKGN